MLFISIRERQWINDIGYEHEQKTEEPEQRVEDTLGA